MADEQWRVAPHRAGGDAENPAPRVQPDPGGRQPRRSSRPFALALIVLQLLMVTLVLHEADMQTSAFRRVVWLALAGFAINHGMPARWRLRFFAALCVAAVIMVMGGAPGTFWAPALALPRAGLFFGVMGVAAVLCRLPIGFWKKAAWLAVVGGAVAVARAGLVETGPLAMVWLVIPAVFMFRIMVYLYDAATGSQRPGWAQTVSYFTLLTNPCALLFPVVDFRTFCRTHYNEEALAIYQRGVTWMVRGLSHLLVYRLVDQLWALRAEDVASGRDLIQYVIANAFLYVKVSGEFNLMIGMLLLFGFNLPETNRRYFLAASFTDYWRRVNVYWKDFIMKLFYYPAYFRFKALGPTWALVLATLWSFLATWALHLYQTWWIKGRATLTLPDILFWTILALLVMANALWEMKRGRQRTLSAGYRMREAAARLIKTAATFTVISVLWSLWSAPSVGVWLHIWSLADGQTLAWGAAMLAVIMGATFVMEVMPTWRRPAAPGLATADYPGSARFRWEAARGAGLVAVMGVVMSPMVQSRLETPAGQPWRDALAVGDRVSHNRLRVEIGAVDDGRGYYESLTAEDRIGTQYEETIRRAAVPYRYVGPTQLRKVRDYRYEEWIPDTDSEAYGGRFRTNRWGMRDRDYELAKAPGTFRIAMFGSSNVAGYGLAAGEMFEPAVEARLNREHGDLATFEVLNFAVNGYGPMANLALLRTRVPAFRPDMVLYVAHYTDYSWTARDPVRLLRAGVPLVDDYVKEALARVRVGPRTHQALGSARLLPEVPRMLPRLYRDFVEEARAIGAVPVYVFLDVPVPRERTMDRSVVKTLMDYARGAGFVVVDLSTLYAGLDPEALMLNEGYRHGNARANAIIAEALYRHLTTDADVALLDRARHVGAPGASTNSP